jgi:hypothetical protein
MRLPGLTLVLLCAATGARAQTPDSIQSRWAYGAWGGLAQNSPSRIFGATAGRDVAVTALRVTRSLRATERVSMPRAANPGAPFQQCPDPQACPLRAAFAEQDAAFGFGASPLGVELRLRPGALVQPFLAASGGMLWFDRMVPQDGASRLNFIADAGGGLLLGRPGHLGLMVGYKLLHISNGGTASLNPGLDNHMLYAGVLRLPRRAPHVE